MSKLSKLFRWSKKVEIKDGDTVLETVYVRLVGDSDFQDAKNTALRSSKTLRISLRDKDSDEHKANFTDLEVLTKDELVMGVAFGEIPDYRDEALLTLPEKVEPEVPDNPTLEEQEEHETALEEIRNERAKSIAEFIEKKSNERKAELNETSDIDELREKYVHSLINMKCSEEFTKSFREYQVYTGTFSDKGFKQLAFDDFDEFEDCAPALKQQLLVAYISLELTGEDLKN